MPRSASAQSRSARGSRVGSGRGSRAGSGRTSAKRGRSAASSRGATPKPQAKRQKTAGNSRRVSAKPSATASGRASKRVSAMHSAKISRCGSEAKLRKSRQNSRESSAGPRSKTSKGRWPKNRIKFKTWADEDANDLVTEVLVSRGWKFDVKGDMCDPNNLDDLLRVARRTDYCLWWLDEEESKIISKCRGNHRVNCLNGMKAACRKTTMSLLKGVKGAPWYPKTLVLPQDADKARELCTSDEISTWIVKPMTGWAGHDIIVYRSDMPEFKEFIEAHAKKRNVIQQYLPNPMLVDGLKFGLRIYTLVTSTNPNTCFLNTNAMHVWFASEPYSMDRQTMGRDFKPRVHLTNRSVNVKPQFGENGPSWDHVIRDKPHLGRSIEMRSEDLFAYCQKTLGKGEEHFWTQAVEICRHTMHGICNYKLVQESNSHLRGKLSDRAFEVFGVDIMVDDTGKLWLCEVNASPGLGKCPPDFGPGIPNPHFENYCNIRRGVIHDLMQLLALDTCPEGDMAHWCPLEID